MEECIKRNHQDFNSEHTCKINKGKERKGAGKDKLVLKCKLRYCNSNIMFCRIWLQEVDFKQ